MYLLFFCVRVSPRRYQSAQGGEGGKVAHRPARRRVDHEAALRHRAHVRLGRIGLRLRLRLGLGRRDERLSDATQQQEKTTRTTGRTETQRQQRTRGLVRQRWMEEKKPKRVPP